MEETRLFVVNNVMPAGQTVEIFEFEMCMNGDLIASSIQLHPKTICGYEYGHGTIYKYTYEEQFYFYFGQHTNSICLFNRRQYKYA